MEREEREERDAKVHEGRGRMSGEDEGGGLSGVGSSGVSNDKVDTVLQPD